MISRLFFAGALLAAGMVVPETRDSQATRSLTDREALSLVTRAMAAEQARVRNGPTASFANVRFIATTTKAIPNSVIDDDSAKFLGHTLRVTRASNGVFVVSLTPDVHCDPAWFGDGKAIYRAKAGDCDR